ncbi:MAG: hypothetical protein CVU46_10420 [Chloroflexi bacterium HGW-Chloroflexi-8]|nr:MAG: hypothetical protein CVU46_10420 [Chloroflexi bacterium HGW-Chloroflexi-8]
MIQDYIRVKTKDEVVGLLEKGYTILGGGTYLSRNQEDVLGLIDIQELGLNKIIPIEDDLVIDSYCTFTEILDNPNVWDSLKDVILQESKINSRNMTTIAGHLLVADGFSNILGWLVCADATIHYYPDKNPYPNKIPEINSLFKSKETFNSFIDSINIPINTCIVWEVISRTPDDFPLVGVFYNKKTDCSIIALTGFCNKVLLFKFNDDLKIYEDFETQLLIAHSQYSNRFISFDYYLKTSTLVLKRLLEKGKK